MKIELIKQSSVVYNIREKEKIEKVFTECVIKNPFMFLMISVLQIIVGMTFRGLVGILLTTEKLRFVRKTGGKVSKSQQELT